MTAGSESSVRWWLAGTAIVGQVAVTAVAVLPPAVLPATAVATVVAARRRARPGRAWARLTPLLALAIGAGVAVRVVAGRSAVTADGLSSMLRTLAGALVLLVLVMAPSWHRSRDYRLWLGINGAIFVAAAAAVGTVSDAVPLVTGFLGLLAAAAVLQMWSASETVDAVAVVTSPAEPARMRRTTAAAVATPVVLASLIGASVYLAVPGGLGGGNLPARLAHFVSPPAGVQVTRTAVGIDTSGSGFLDLRARGALPKTPLLAVPDDSPALWRGTVYVRYDGSMWLPDNQRGTVVRGTDVTLTPSRTDPVPVGVTRTDVVHPQTADVGDLVWAPGVVRRVRADMLGVFRSASSSRVFGRSRGVAYTVTSVVPESSPQILAAATGAADADAMWTALPAELPARVVALAQRITVGASGRYAQVQAIESYLRLHETYSLDSPVPAAGEDAVDRFLFRDHIGFCEQFASATTVLLRALDVPARVVTGLAYGHPAGGGERMLTAADAHAWVEVYFPSVGWVPTDPTAGVSLAPASAAASSGPLAWLRPVVDRIPAGAAGLVTAMLLVMVAVGVAVRRRRRRGRRRFADQAVGTGRIVAAFHAFARRSRRPRHEAETAREYVERVAPDAGLDDAVRDLEVECYGPTPPDAGATDLAVAHFHHAAPGHREHKRATRRVP
jgi:protein-glutamine gamma-glutamyltransferase